MLIKHKNKILIVNSFDFSNIGLKQIRKNCKYKTFQNNYENYAKWIIQELSKIDNRKKFNACCIYMNNKNIMKLHSRLDAMTWLNISPCELDDLADDQYAVDLSELYAL